MNRTGRLLLVLLALLANTSPLGGHALPRDRPLPGSIAEVVADGLANPVGAVTGATLPASTTTTTMLASPTTTLSGGGIDVTGGARVYGGFGAGGYDLYMFDLVSPVVLVAETSDGFDHCSGDTTMELDFGGVSIAFDDESGPGHCSRIVKRLLAPGTYEIRVAGYLGEAVPSYVLDVEFVETVCGNNIVELAEECDDGNTLDGDCCSSDCVKAPDATPCDDGLLCDGEDTCLGGVCSQHALNPCPGPDGDNDCAESCSDSAEGCTWPDPDGSPCNDGLFCDGADRCIAGVCSLHAGNPCRGPDGDGHCAESCNEATDSCTLQDPNFSPCDDGLWCNGTDQCGGGTCSIHSGNPCPGPDGDGNCSESCNEAAHNCTGPDPNGSPCDDGLFCTGADQCAGGTCSFHAGSGCPGADGDGNCAESCNEAAHSCNAADPDGSACNDGVFCNGSDKCSGGTCSVHTGNPCPGADGDNNCSESCSEANHNCSAPDPNGSACNDGLFCNGADTCTSGLCAQHAGNPCPGPDGDGNCSESCSEATDSCTAADPNGAPCDDGLFCDGADSCLGGVCSVHAGNPCAGPDGDGNCAESCDEATDACTASDPDGSLCDDGVFCNGKDTCSGGTCSVHAGNPCPGADGDGNCSESCNEAADACTAPDPDGSACNDGLFCNGADTCLSGVCAQHAGNPCPGADGDGDCAESCNEATDSCTAADPNGSACNDGLFCNGADTCLGGVCSVHAGNPCPGPDGDGNCAESCNEAADACTAPDPNGSACDDGLFCNGSDTCSGGSCSVHTGNPCPGADGDGNCSESCSEAAGSCTAPDPDGSACNDGLLCNGTDTCSSGFCTVHSGDPCPGADGDGNCSESCSDSASGCTGPDPVGSPCDDGIFCNGADTCSGGTCSVHAGNPCPGADGDDNCSESCNEAAKTCSAPDPNGSPCNDGVFCNGADTCLAGSCSVHAGDPCPGPDGDGNCAESCNEAAAACTAADPNGSPCNDGLFCNGADTCLGGSCSVHAGDPCPGPDGDGNCAESCNENSDSCTAPDIDGSSCDDGLFCDGTDTCANGACSVHAGDPCPGADGDADCSESCNEANDSCTANDPNGSACDDGVFCNGADTCVAGVCSGHSGNPCPGPDHDDDCAESCDENGKTCTAFDPDGSACDDGVFCNGADSCAAGLCSVHAGDPCPGSDGDGNCSESCNEAAAACTAADPQGSPCLDSDPCTVGETCNGSGQCTGGETIDCADDDPCTADACQDGQPHCVHTPIPKCPPTTTTSTTLVESVLCGDANGDGGRTAGDALLVLKAAVGGPFCSARPCICDANGNGLVTASDALAVLRAAVGIPQALNCPC